MDDEELLEVQSDWKNTHVLPSSGKLMKLSLKKHYSDTTHNRSCVIFKYPRSLFFPTAGVFSEQSSINKIKVGVQLSVFMYTSNTTKRSQQKVSMESKKKLQEFQRKLLLKPIEFQHGGGAELRTTSNLTTTGLKQQAAQELSNRTSTDVTVEERTRKTKKRQQKINTDILLQNKQAENTSAETLHDKKKLIN